MTTTRYAVRIDGDGRIMARYDSVVDARIHADGLSATHRVAQVIDCIDGGREFWENGTRTSGNLPAIRGNDNTPLPNDIADIHGNVTATEGVSRCDCGCKYWENDRCIDCGLLHDPL